MSGATFHSQPKHFTLTIKVLSTICSLKKGGVASGMRHTETNSYDVKRLLHVKGKKRVTAKEVSAVTAHDASLRGQLVALF